MGSSLELQGKERRQRTRGSLNQWPQAADWCSWNSAHSPADVNYSATVYCGKVEDMVDYVTPGFAYKRSKGGLVNSPMSYVSKETIGTSVGPRFVRYISPKYYYLDYGNNWMQLPGNPGYPTTTATLLVGFQDLLAEVETRARAGIAQPDIQSLVNLGELRETIKFLTNPFRGGLQLAAIFQKKKRTYEQLLNKEFRKQGIQAKVWSETTVLEMRRNASISSHAAELLDRLASLYLEFRFGLMPLVREAEAIALALTAAGHSPRITSRSRSSRSGDDSWVGTLTAAGITYNWTDNRHRTVEIRSGFLYEHYFSADEDKWGLTALDIPKAAWQLIPLSFIVDRFLNVSSFIGALTPRGGTKILLSYTTITQTQDIARTFGTSSVALYTQDRAAVGNLRSRVVTKQRFDYVGPPALTIRTDNIRTMAGEFLQLADVFALVYQRIY